MWYSSLQWRRGWKETTITTGQRWVYMGVKCYLQEYERRELISYKSRQDSADTHVKDYGLCVFAYRNHIKWKNSEYQVQTDLEKNCKSRMDSGKWANLQAETWMHQRHNIGLPPVLNMVCNLQPDGSTLLTATATLPSLSLSQFLSLQQPPTSPSGRLIAKCCHFSNST